MNVFTYSDPTLAVLEALETFVERHPHGNFFQSAAGFRFFQKVDGYRPLLLTVQRDSKIIGSLLALGIQQGGGPKGYLSRRSIVFGGPLLPKKQTDASLVLQALLTQLDQKNRGIFTEFRNHFDMSNYQIAFEQHGYQYLPHLNFIVTIQDDVESTMRLLSSSKRRQVRKAFKNGTEVREPESMEEVRAFYDILQDLYRTKVKKPLAAFSLFEQFFLDKNAGKYLLVYYQEKVIGGIVCPIYKDTIYELYVAGLDGEFGNVYPSVVATWAPMEYAARHGLKYFDFMGAGKPDEDYGVREFKSKFGGDLKEYGRYQKINKPLFYSVGKTGLKLLQKIS